MVLSNKWTRFLKYSTFQKLVEGYYYRKYNSKCFVMYQNSRWTLVYIRM